MCENQNGVRFETEDDHVGWLCKGFACVLAWHFYDTYSFEQITVLSINWIQLAPFRIVIKNKRDNVVVNGIEIKLQRMLMQKFRGVQTVFVPEMQLTNHFFFWRALFDFLVLAMSLHYIYNFGTWKSFL